jgi:CO/xanthine dehydrogenase Mo-binding subunit
MVTFNSDGSVNVITGIVEIGQGTLTGLAQIAAEKLAITPEKVHVVRDVFTDRQPHDWTTAASRSLFMAGNALCSALDDAIAQIKEVAAYPLRCQPHDLEVAGEKVYLRDNPDQSIDLSAIVTGYTFANGNSIGGPIIGRGSYIARRISDIDPETGKGEPALEYTLGAAATEVEVDPKDGTYRVLKAVCVMDVGKVINPKLARNQTVGGMLMGLGFCMREGFVFDSRHKLQTESLRDYKLPRFGEQPLPRFGEQPEYIVDFVETPQRDGPFNARGLGEQSILGMPGALANALSKALNIHLNALPLTPETLWKANK